MPCCSHTAVFLHTIARMAYVEHQEKVDASATAKLGIFAASAARGRSFVKQATQQPGPREK